MKSLNLINSISRIAGGVAPAVMESVQVQRRMQIDAQVATLLDDFTAEDGARYGVDYEAVPGYTTFGYAPGLKARLLRGQTPDLIHAHGMWTYCDYLALQLSVMQGIPLVVSPHGMMRPWAFYHSWWKKRPIWWLWEKRKNTHAAVIVATSTVEAREIRLLGIRTPVAVIPHGLTLPSLSTPKPVNTPKIALFLSRLHPVKALPLLIDAVARLHPEGWKFVIAGPDVGGHGEEMKAKVYAAGLDKLFDFPGPMYGDAKWASYHQADLFILPTLSENFGIVVAEALACETPVLTTTRAPWEELQTHGCGWWVDATVDALTAALTEALSQPPAVLHAMGQRGRTLMQGQYTWERSVTRLLALYAWVLGQAKRPPFVMID